MIGMLLAFMLHGLHHHPHHGHQHGWRSDAPSCVIRIPGVYYRHDVVFCQVPMHWQCAPGAGTGRYCVAEQPPSPFKTTDFNWAGQARAK